MSIKNNNFLSQVLARLKAERLALHLQTSDVENQLKIGKGWLKSIEDAEVSPSLDLIAAIAAFYGKNLSEIVQGISNSSVNIDRPIRFIQNKNDLEIHFKYARHDAVYILNNASISQAEYIVEILRNGLSESPNNDDKDDASFKTESVANAFIAAMNAWPHANPSDIWWFLVYRAFCDPYNHPATSANLDLSQSWKRTGGWALERILEKHYGPYLKQHGINIFIASSEKRQYLISKLNLGGHRLEADKMDVLITVGEGERENLIGVVHVKASFAERRTDDVPMSQALVQAGYISPLWTMDCKSTPSNMPLNKGELGKLDNRSAKRKDIEDDLFFSSCFSYNRNTIPTDVSNNTSSRVYVCDFSNPDDDFSRFIIRERSIVKTKLGI